MKIQLSPIYFIDVSNWTLLRITEKSTGGKKEKQFTFNNLHNMMLSIRAKHYADDIDEANAIKVEEFITKYEDAIRAFRSLLAPHKGRKIEFSVGSVTGGPDHFSASLKNHGQISLSRTYHSNSRLSKENYSVETKFPGSHEFAAQLIFDQELSDSLILTKKRKPKMADLVEVMDIARSKICASLSDVQSSRYSDVDQDDQDLVDEDEEMIDSDHEDSVNQA